jgi:hypothetical protein
MRYVSAVVAASATIPIMRLRSYSARLSMALAVLGLCVLGPARHALAQHAIDPDAQSVLSAMSTYLGSLKSFSVDYAATDEVISTEGQKLQFLHSGEVVVERPNKVYAIRKGAAGSAEIFLNGKMLSLYSKSANAYLQMDESSIDDAIVALHNLGFDAPGADILASKPLDNSTTDIVSGTHVGMTYIDGVEVNQLAFRGKDVDWQLWVTTGDKPLPVRYVVTTKWFAGAPEFTLQLRNWNTAPKIDAAEFTFTPPQGAKKLDPASVEVDAIGDMSIKSK